MNNSGSLKQILWPFRLLIDKDRRGWNFRLMRRYGMEVAYLLIAIRGLEFDIEFPSTWHEESRGWVRIGFGFGVLAVSFPWKKLAPDHGQCSGPRYGFQFYDDLLWIHYGQDTGRSKDPKRSWSLYMPWHWRHQWHVVDTEPMEAPYRYMLRSGEVQERMATIQAERRCWTRYWLPWRQVSHSIDVRFNGEVGEETGSWKGGTIGCGFEMKPRESPLECLRRMEQERKF